MLLCKSLEDTAEFYEQLGFPMNVSNNVGRVVFGDFRLAFMNENTVVIETGSQDKPKGAGIFFYFEVENVDSFFDSLAQKDIKTTSEPKSFPHGKREFTLQDPDGYNLIFFSNI